MRKRRSDDQQSDSGARRIRTPNFRHTPRHWRASRNRSARRSRRRSRLIVAGGCRSTTTRSGPASRRNSSSRSGRPKASTILTSVVILTRRSRRSIRETVLGASPARPATVRRDKPRSRRRSRNRAARSRDPKFTHSSCCPSRACARCTDAVLMRAHHAQAMRSFDTIAPKSNEPGARRSPGRPRRPGSWRISARPTTTRCAVAKEKIETLPSTLR